MSHEPSAQAPTSRPRPPFPFVSKDRPYIHSQRNKVSALLSLVIYFFVFPPMRPLLPFVCRLPSRRILRVRGADAHEYLQGMFTNDLRELHPSGSLYGCFLHFTGRVMCDAHLHQCKRVHDGQASILVDVDEECAEELFEHLNEMKMRKKLLIENVGADLAVVATLEYSGELEGSAKTCSTEDTTGSCGSSGDSGSDGRASTETMPSRTLEKRQTECFVDARNGALFPPPSMPKVPVEETSRTSRHAANSGGGCTPAAASPSSPPLSSQSWCLKRCVVPLTWAPPLSCTDPYFRLLYSRGIGEGPATFKTGKALPFEGNLDFLKGVSFHKGCYVGQELTHRTHVMLVTRKRTVPLRFGSADQPTPRLVEVGEPLYSAEKEKIGEVTGVCGDLGVGLLRLRYVEKESRTVPGLQLTDGMPVRVFLPDWWPRKEVKKLLKNSN
ncbi:hypothetical protein ABL78_1674 [Leptomonas seymouri]|uniref:CAF17 C-terminal domain-containing protein n=1 Tax=Leptomonas seymouri TaxID=5684 RepID=A0A0N1IM11_LEPSE|nr:hypothetical protein ABL78_1674 [Leptomonas seymouri]|eukprot:KPI89182.1 hypothetical protein ABL78_1674 [Leptomonas seymouri]